MKQQHKQKKKTHKPSIQGVKTIITFTMKRNDKTIMQPQFKVLPSSNKNENLKKNLVFFFVPPMKMACCEEKGGERRGGNLGGNTHLIKQKDE
jgi:hypothetical protein